MPSGKVVVRMEVTADPANRQRAGRWPVIADRHVGERRIEHGVPVRFSGYAGMDIGRDNGGDLDVAYEAQKPFPFTGTIGKVVFDIKPHLYREGRVPRPCGQSNTVRPRTPCRNERK